jgi:hypothetical protein
MRAVVEQSWFPKIPSARVGGWSTTLPAHERPPRRRYCCGPRLDFNHEQQPDGRGAISDGIGGARMGAIKRLQGSFDQVWVTGGVATLFYDRLFLIAPHTRSLFSADMESQR